MCSNFMTAVESLRETEANLNLDLTKVIYSIRRLPVDDEDKLITRIWFKNFWNCENVELDVELQSSLLVENCL